jgi:hypothetical protein
MKAGEDQASDPVRGAEDGERRCYKKDVHPLSGHIDSKSHERREEIELHFGGDRPQQPDKGKRRRSVIIE